jgi:mannose/fructose/N-acetylgalactosamine-specific phosphotransferase system component IID
MQNVGFCFAMLPALKRSGLSGDAAKRFLKRHLAFFNTNPATASYVLGAAAAAEVAEPDGAGGSVEEMKKALLGPLGMAGDALLWGTVRPLAGIMGAGLALTGRPWAPLVLLAIYNVPHLALRARGIAAGAAHGPSAAREVLGPRMKDVVRGFRWTCAFTAGFVVALAVAPTGRFEWWRLAIAGASFALAFAAAKLRIPATVVAAAAALGALALMLARTYGG